MSNGAYLNYAMLYHDSVAFLLSNDLGIPAWIHQQEQEGGVTPQRVARHFDLSLRAASAILVTLCRMQVVQVLEDSDESVDDIVYRLTPSAQAFLADPSSEAATCPFISTFHTNFTTPEKLLGCSRREEKDLMSEHLEESNEDVANNARHFMAHMNGQSYSCARAFAAAPELFGDASRPLRLLDVGGGSGIFAIEAARFNPKLEGIIYELPAIKPITEEYIEQAGLTSRIRVEAGDFFGSEPFPRGMDAVLFSNILHDWPDETNVRLLQKALDCLEPGARVIISEMLLADDVQSSSSSATSMNIIMLPYTKGRQYRPKELHRRLDRLGFVNPRTRALVDDYSLVIAEKPV